jgi:DNA-binding CsgD family transcriptional regulator
VTAGGAWPVIGRGQTVHSIVTALLIRPKAPPVAALVRAPLGGGKTRVIDEVAEALEAKGRTVRRIVATTATSAVPFGAVAHLIPVGARDSSEPVGTIAALQDVLAPANATRPVMVVDDVPLLDTATAGVLAALLGSGAADLLAAGRTGEALPSPLVDILLGERSVQAELPPLSEDDVDTLLHLVLGGPVDLAVVVAMLERTRGNPLFVRELTRSGLEDGTIVDASGVWRLRGPLPGSARLREVVESRLDRVPPSSRPALELLALCGVVDLDELESMIGLEALAELEDRGLVRIVQRAGRAAASLAHPLHNEAIRMALPSLRSRLLLRNHIAWIEQHPEIAAADVLQEAIWRLDAGLVPDAATLLRGTQVAAVMRDSRSARRLARPLFDLQLTAEVGWLLANALFQIGHFEESFGVIEQSLALDPTPAVRVDLAVIRATMLLWGLGDAESALSSLDVLLADPAMSATNRTRLTAERASVLVNSGRPGQVIADLEVAFNGDDLQLQLGSTVSYAIALAAGGRTGDAVAIVERALVLRGSTPVYGVADVDVYYVAKAFALVEAGRLDEAAALSEQQFADAVNTERPLTQFWFSLTLGRVHLCRGAASTALRFLRSARSLAFDAGMRGPARTALLGIVQAAAMLQEAAVAADALAEMDTLPAFGFMAPERPLADAWEAVARGDLITARKLLTDAAEPAVESGHVTSAIWLLHDAARLGCAPDVVGQITELAARTDSKMAAARAEHVRAVVAGGASELAAAADRFEALGAYLYAGEAATAAAEAARAAGDQREAAALAARAERFLALCEGAATPALASSAGGVEPLTDREREIAFLAASGLTSRQIADQLFLSYRTVNNHLQHVYDKLGTRGRSGLRDALGIA